MTSPSNARLGLSLLEAMIALSIAALILGIAVPALRPPPRHLELQETLAGLERDALAVRLSAIRAGAARSWQPNGSLCPGQSAAPVLYLPDGSAFGDPFCVRIGSQDLWVVAAALTGRLKPTDAGRQ